MADVDELYQQRYGTLPPGFGDGSLGALPAVEAPSSDMGAYAPRTIDPELLAAGGARIKGMLRKVADGVPDDAGELDLAGTDTSGVA